MIKYFCDRCGKEVPDENVLRSVPRAVEKKIAGKLSMAYDIARVCEDCIRQFWHKERENDNKEK